VLVLLSSWRWGWWYAPHGLLGRAGGGGAPWSGREVRSRDRPSAPRRLRWLGLPTLAVYGRAACPSSGDYAVSVLTELCHRAVLFAASRHLIDGLLRHGELRPTQGGPISAVGAMPGRCAAQWLGAPTAGRARWR
jgi:hypothetical protein